MPPRHPLPILAGSALFAAITNEQEQQHIGRMIAADVRQASGSDRWKAVEEPAEQAALGDTRNASAPSNS